MKKCAIIRNGFFSCDAMENQIDSISEELRKLGVCTVVLNTSAVLTRIIEGNVKSEIGDYDFIVFLDKDAYISHMLEKCGYNLVNSASAVEVCDDKMKTYIALSGKGINLPDTIASPLNYAGKDDESYLDVEKLLGYPIVVKEVYGSMGKSVYLAKDREGLRLLSSRLKTRPHLYQKFVGNGGKDLRVIVIGKKAVGAIQRINDKDFRSNVELGGKAIAVELTEDVALLSEKVAEILGLDYCGVDILSDGEKLYVCEVNSNAFFKGFCDATGINVAELYAKYLYKKFY